MAMSKNSILAMVKMTLTTVIAQLQTLHDAIEREMQNE